MSVVSKLKNIMPSGVKDVLRDMEAPLVLRYETILQMHRYGRSYSKRLSQDKQHIEPRITFATHQIEKGLSHTQFKAGFGIRPLKQLSMLLSKLRVADKGYKDNPVYRMALSALQKYWRRNSDVGYDLSAIEKLFTPDIVQEIGQANEGDGGTMVIHASTKSDNAIVPFRELMRRRHSIREYSDEPVLEDQIVAAVDLAMCTPSVCNRQPARVHIITNRTQCEQALKVQHGFGGYQVPPALVLITADNSVFMNPDERNEGFVDGGLFSMSLLLALEEQGLAACPLNTMMAHSNEVRTRNLLQIPDNEYLIMYIAVGHFLEVVDVPRSKRFVSSDIVTFHR